VRWIGRFQRQSATASDLRRQLDNISSLDTTDRMSEIAVPTLVLHGVGDAVTPAAAGRGIAETIPGARFIELQTDDHFLLSALDGPKSPTRHRIRHGLSARAPQRAPLRHCGLHRHRRIYGAHNGGRRRSGGATLSIVTTQIAWDTAERHHGTIVKSTGDGLLARFDSPSQAVQFASDRGRSWPHRSADPVWSAHRRDRAAPVR